MNYSATLGHLIYSFDSLAKLMAAATPKRSADELAGLAAKSEQERVAAQMILANLPLKEFLNVEVIAAKDDEVTRLIQSEFKAEAFSYIAHMTVGELREWLLAYTTQNSEIAKVRDGLTPEMVAAVSKIMRNQDLVAVSAKISNVTKFRNTIGLKGHIGVRLQPNHPTDDAKGILCSIIDGLLLGAGDAVIGINPASDSPKNVNTLLTLIDNIREKLSIPTQSCVLSHVTTQIELMKKKAPVDLVFQSIAGTELANKSFGVTLNILEEAYLMALDLKRGTIGNNVMYFETGQGSALSANANFGVDAQTCEVRAYAVAKKFNPFLVNTVVGFIGPEYLFNGKQITRAGLEDMFCGKLMGLPMGCDICYTNHTDADQNDMDGLLTLLGVAGTNFIIGVPGADDIMLNYQSTSFHDALYLREVLNLKPAPEFHEWLKKMQLFDEQNHLMENKKMWELSLL